MPIGTAAAIAMALGTLASGVGGGIAANKAAGATKSAAEQAALGPIRGGSSRAGGPAKNMGVSVDPSVMENLGKNMIPLRNPVYGGQPIDLNSLYNPQKFGTGFNLNNKF